MLLVAFPLLSDDVYYQNMIILSLVFAVGASGLNIITGFAGYVSLGQGAFIGLGGYTIGVLATKYPDVNVWLWVPVAGVVAACRGPGPRAGLAAVARPVVRDHHRRVPVPGPGDRGQLGSLTGGTAGLTLPLPDLGPRHHQLAVLLRRWSASSRCRCC